MGGDRHRLLSPVIAVSMAAACSSSSSPSDSCAVEIFTGVRYIDFGDMTAMSVIFPATLDADDGCPGIATGFFATEAGARLAGQFPSEPPIVSTFEFDHSYEATEECSAAVSSHFEGEIYDRDLGTIAGTSVSAIQVSPGCAPLNGPGCLRHWSVDIAADGTPGSWVLDDESSGCDDVPEEPFSLPATVKIVGDGDWKQVEFGAFSTGDLYRTGDSSQYVGGLLVGTSMYGMRAEETGGVVSIVITD